MTALEGIRPRTDGASNPLNFPKVQRFEIGFDGKPTKVESRIRYGVRAPEGYSVIAADLSQIEARIVACLAGQDDLVRGFANGEDVYSDCAEGLFQRPVSKELAKTDPVAENDRKAGKDIILGCGFGMGWKKFKRQSRKSGLNLDDTEAMRYVEYYRRRYDMVPDLWESYDKAMKRLLFEREPTTLGPVTFEWVDEKARLAGIRRPNGLHLLYPRLRMQKDKDQGWQLLCNQARDKFPRKLWGGAITENVVQSLARDIIVDGMIGIQMGLGLRTALQVYDEVVLVVPTEKVEYYAKAIVPILTRSPGWMPDLPVGVEVNYGPTYGDC